MKKLTFAFALFCIAGSTYAQEFLAGLQGGTHCYGSLDNKLEGHSHMVTLDKSLFLRYETGNKWAFELAAGHEVFRKNTLTTESYTREYFVPGPFEGSIRDKRGIDRTSYNLSLKAEYELSLPNTTQCPLLSRFKNFIGIVAGPSFVQQQRLSEIYTENTGQSQFFTYDESSVHLWTGLTTTLQFSLASHVQLFGNASGQVNCTGGNFLSSGIADSYAGYYDPNIRFLVSLGAAYRF